MPRLKKITLDADSGKAIESPTNPRLARKPVFYSGETVAVDVNLLELTPNSDGTSSYSEVKPSGSNQVFMRLGTTTTLVAQGTDFSYVPPARYQATLGFTTAPAVQIPLTIQTDQVPTVAPVFEVVNFSKAVTTATSAFGAVTALLRAVMSQTVVPAVTVPVPIELPDAFRYPGMEVFVAGTAITFSAAVNSPVSAGFSVTTSADSVSAIAITRAGSGYPDGTYSLTLTGGTVTTAAQATCVASGGSIISVTIVTGGSGYVTKPAASLFTPDRSITAVYPSIIRATINDRPRFHWHRPAGTNTVVTLSCTVPTSTSTPVTAASPVVRMEYVATDSEGMPLWEINLVSGGYGYLTVPAVSAPAHTVSARRRTTTASVAGNDLIVSVTYDNDAIATAEDGSLIPGSDPYHLALSGPYYDRGLNTVDGRGPFPNGVLGAEFRSGTYSLITNGNTPSGQAKVAMLPAARGSLGRSVLGYGIATQNNFLRLAYEPNQLTAQKMRELAGRSFICAVIPQREPNLPASVSTVNALNETAPDRYAIVRVTLRDYPGGFPDYYVGQTYYASSGSQTIAVTQGLLSPEGTGTPSFAPGGGFFEPTIEFLDYGKGYKTPQFVGTNAHQRFSYNLRVLSGLKPGYVIDETPGGRTVTAVTTGSLDTDSFIQTAYSERATVVTQQGEQGIQTVVYNSGFGYQKAGYYVASQATSGGRIRYVEVINRPAGYGYGSWSCTVTGGGGSGAEIVLEYSAPARNPYSLDNNLSSLFNNMSGSYTARVVCAGSGYTSTPSIIAPGPSSQGNYTRSIVAGGSVYGLEYAFPSGTSTTKDNLDPTKAAFVVAKSRFLSSLGYEITPENSLSQTSLDENGRPYSSARTKVTRYYGCVCNGVYYKTKNITIKTLDIMRRGLQWVSTDPDNPVPNNFDLVDKCFEYEFPGPVYKYPLVIDESPEPYGTAEGFVIFTPVDVRRPSSSIRIFITKTGYGYVTKPSITIQAPPISGYYIKSVDIADGFGSVLPDFDGNRFYGVDPSSFVGAQALTGGGRQLLQKAVLYPNSGVPVNISYDQFGQTTNVVTGGYVCEISPSPIIGDDQYRLNVQELNFYNQRNYQYNHAQQLANNVPAAVERERIWQKYEGKKVHYVQRRDFSPAIYSTIPTVSAPTFSGCVITAVTVVCQGYWYSKETATITNLDPTGSGAVITVSEVKNGKITKVQISEGGALFSDNPQIIVSQPTDNPADTPSNFGFKNNLPISSVSAASVLADKESADVLLEVYEVDGANQNVMAQLPVTLTKRVSSV